MTNAQIVAMLKTIEFWVTLVSTVAAALITSGLIPIGGAAMKIAMFIMTILNAYGFASKVSIRNQNEVLSDQVNQLKTK